MLDIQQLRQEISTVVTALGHRGYTLDAVRFAELDAAMRHWHHQLQALQTQRNAASKAMGMAKTSGQDWDSDKQAELHALSEQLDACKKAYTEAESQLHHFCLDIPNMPLHSVPFGQNESDNVCERTWGDVSPKDAQALKDHVALFEKSDRLDFTAGHHLAASRFCVLRGQLAHLHRALTQFMLDVHVKKGGYEEVYVPYLVNASTLVGTGQLPKFEEDLFHVPTGNQDFYLIPTAEVALTNLVRDARLPASQLPLKWVAHTPCFRREAGSYGKDTRGILRQHQFDKVELVQVVLPEHGEAALDELVTHASGILEQLKLPYRVMNLCTGDLGFSARKTYDIEVWLPGQQRYREISSCSYCGDFQARRMKARWRPDGEKRSQWLHTLNGSGLAVGRTLIAVLENYQQADGTVRVPDVLRPYLPFDVLCP